VDLPPFEGSGAGGPHHQGRHRSRPSPDNPRRPRRRPPRFRPPFARPSVPPPPPAPIAAPGGARRARQPIRPCAPDRCSPVNASTSAITKVQPLSNMRQKIAGAHGRLQARFGRTSTRWMEIDMTQGRRHPRQGPGKSFEKRYETQAHLHALLFVKAVCRWPAPRIPRSNASLGWHQYGPAPGDQYRHGRRARLGPDRSGPSRNADEKKISSASSGKPSNDLAERARSKKTQARGSAGRPPSPSPIPASFGGLFRPAGHQPAPNVGNFGTRRRSKKSAPW